MKRRLFILWNKEHPKPQVYPSNFWKTRYLVDLKVISSSGLSCMQLHRYIAKTLILRSRWSITLKPFFMQSPIVSGHPDCVTGNQADHFKMISMPHRKNSSITEIGFIRLLRRPWWSWVSAIGFVRQSNPKALPQRLQVRSWGLLRTPTMAFI